MLINKTQINSIKGKTTENLVRSGVEPTIFEVYSAVDDYFMNYKLGRPTFKPMEIEPHKVSNKMEWNKSVKELGNDIGIMVDSINILKDNVITMEDTIDYKKSLAESKIKNLNLRIKSLKNSLSSDEVYLGKSFTFYNFYDTEFYGNENINLPYTTAFVDLLYKRVTSQKTTLINAKYNLESSEILLSSSSNADGYSVSGDIRNIVNDSINGSCMIEQSGISDDKRSIDITIVLPEPVTLSTISIVLNTINDIEGSLTLNTVDGEEVKIYTETFSDTIEWNFDSPMIVSFKITLSKLVADGVNDNMYKYYYIIKNISASLDTFERTSSYISKKIEYDEILDEVNVVVDEMIMPDTNIQYFVGIDNEVDIIDWISVSNGKNVSLNVLKPEEAILNKRLSNYGESVGDDCYKVGTIRNHVNRNSIKILSGYQQWNAEVFNKPNFDVNYKINIADYDKDFLVGTKNIDAESYKLTIKENKLVVMQTTVFCDDDYVLDENEIKSITNGAKLQTELYLNNNKIPVGSNKTYSLPFKKGRNKVIILMYSTGAAETNILFNVNFKRVSQNIGCGGKMKLISIDSLRLNVMVNTNNYYAIDNSNNIIVKYNPKMETEYIKSEYSGNDVNYQDYMRYYLSYKYLPKDKYNKCLKNGVPNVNIRFMATLFSNKDTLSPQIKSYSILAK